MSTAPDLLYPFDTLPDPGTTLEVAPGVRWVRMRLPFALDHINLWLLDDGDRVVVIDCGYASPDTRDAWDAVLAADGRPIGRVILTHPHPHHVAVLTCLAFSTEHRE